MTKKIVEKRKLKVFNLLLVLLVLIGLFFAFYFLIKAPIKNIVIKNTNYLNDDYIIELADIKDYPSFIMTSSLKMKKKLLKSPYIEDVKIKKRYGFILEIDIVENIPLFYNNNTNKYVLSNGKEINNDELNNSISVPRLLNYVPDKKFEQFIKRMNRIKKEILLKTSDIEYKPNDYDKDRFLLYMDDGNMVYLTLTKFKTLNHYNEVLPQLEGHKGILYLDNGNHFEIKE